MVQVQGPQGVRLGVLQAGAMAAVDVAVVVVVAADVEGAAAAVVVVVVAVAAAAAGAEDVAAVVAEVDAQDAVAACAGRGGGGMEGVSENSRWALRRGDLCPGVGAWKEGAQQGVSDKERQKQE